MNKRVSRQTIRQTPWGPAQSKVVIARGLVQYKTESHGGFYLDKMRNNKVHMLLQRSTFCGLGVDGWYEEDIDWAIVVYTFPELFDAGRRETALDYLQHHHKEAWLVTQESAIK